MIKVIVPISGGKDSQACLKLALSEYKKEEVLGLFCDTKFEHPCTYNHVKWMGEFYGIEIKTITGGSVEEKIKKYKRFPGGGARFCTDELKIRESKIFYREFSLAQGGFEVWYGMRSEESHERKKRYKGRLDAELYPPHEIMPSKYPQYLEKQGVMFRLPIIDWAESEVLDFVGDELNPLYSHGFGRVGCFPCMASGDKWKEKAFSFDETGRKHFKIMKELESITEYPIYTSKAGQFKERQHDLFSGCSICAI